MKGYKAFEKGLVCKGKQYAENTIFEEEKAEICECGMHFCENPLEVLKYYPLIDDNGEIVEVAEVEALDEAKTNDNKKYCTKKLKVGVKLSLPAFIKAAIDFMFEKAESTSGDSAKLASSGNYAQLASSGDYAQLASSGDYAKLASSGNSAKLASSGNSAQLASSGNSAQLASSGNSAKLASSGNDSIIAGIGIDNIAKGVKGNWLVLAEWKYNDDLERYIPICVKSKKIDGKTLKENTFYRLENGKFVEV